MGSIISTPYFLEAVNIKVRDIDHDLCCLETCLIFGGHRCRYHIDSRFDMCETTPHKLPVRANTGSDDVGCMVGCLVAAGYGASLGRKKTIAIGMVIMIVGAILQTTSYSVAQLIIGRVISGIGNGMNTVRPEQAVSMEDAG